MSGEQQGDREESMSEAVIADAATAVEPAPGEPAATDVTEPVAVGPGDGSSGAPLPVPALSGTDASLLALVDRLTAVMERSDLGELEVASGGTTIILRAPSAVERPVVAVPATAEAAPGAAPTQGQAAAAATATVPRPSVKAPLTGIWYGAPSPGATPYVRVGDHVSVGQIIGLIEAMKLFNEIKSDLAGRVLRVCVDNGALVKARQPVIEVEPA